MGNSLKLVVTKKPAVNFDSPAVTPLIDCINNDDFTISCCA